MSHRRSPTQPPTQAREPPGSSSHVDPLTLMMERTLPLSAEASVLSLAARSFASATHAVIASPKSLSRPPISCDRQGGKSLFVEGDSLTQRAARSPRALRGGRAPFE